MPMADSHLTSLSNPSAHLWLVAKQLFEAVEFMHQHGVAYLDLKPQNILPADGGRLSIIDFNRSVRVKGTETMFRGTVDTTGYLAPEVAGQAFKAYTARSARTCGPAERHWRSCAPCVDHPGVATRYSK
ncbi:kinase-like domain-containing protein [Suillus placidus]|uniref:Kinase-like domain-containing protein n=2 Tax=Suillus placidus TaxID=48579 RepID=A0A9P6ZF44_9AGAM|nr:kinase-like domain-containing protein [Suillus placidus]